MGVYTYLTLVLELYQVSHPLLYHTRSYQAKFMEFTCIKGKAVSQCQKHDTSDQGLTTTVLREMKFLRAAFTARFSQSYMIVQFFSHRHSSSAGCRAWSCLYRGVVKYPGLYTPKRWVSAAANVQCTCMYRYVLSDEIFNFVYLMWSQWRITIRWCNYC